MKRLLGFLCAFGLAASCFGFDERLDRCRRLEGVCAIDSGLVDAGTTDAGANDAGPDDAGCQLDPNNLLLNGSFERQSDAGIPGWVVANATLTQRTVGGARCAGWLEVSSADPQVFELDGDFDLGAPAPMGTRFVISGWARTLDQNPNPLEVHLRARSGGYRVGSTGRLDLSGGWTPFTLELELADPSNRLSVEILATGPRVLGLDGISAVQLP